MTAPNRRGIVAMQFEDGTSIDTWNSLDLRDTFTDPLGDLSFESIPPRGRYQEYRARLAKGSAVTVSINGVSQGRYIIQEVERAISTADGAAIRVRCHTPLITPYEGNVDPDVSIASQTDVPVTDAILKAMAPYGFDRIIGDTAASVAAMSGKPLGGRPASVTVGALKHQDAVAHEGETAYSFCARIFTRLGCALRISSDGVLMVGAPQYDTAVNDTLRQSFTGGLPGDYFVGTVTVHDSNAGQFSEAIVRGQRADTGDASTARPVSRITEAELHPLRPSYVSTAAPYKPKIFHDKSSRDKARALSCAKLEMGLRAEKAFYVQGEVDGMVSATGRLWQVDTMVHVVIEAEGLDEDMWVAEVRRTADAAGGQRTHLRLLPKGALVLGDIPQ